MPGCQHLAAFLCGQPGIQGGQEVGLARTEISLEEITLTIRRYQGLGDNGKMGKYLRGKNEAGGDFLRFDPAFF